MNNLSPRKTVALSMLLAGGLTLAACGSDNATDAKVSESASSASSAAVSSASSAASSARDAAESNRSSASSAASSISSEASSSASSASSSASASANPTDGWPRQVTTLPLSSGPTPMTIDAAPQRVVSLDPVITGDMLVRNLPVVAATTFPGKPGFPEEWANQANQKSVDLLIVDAALGDAVAAQNPDLIITTKGQAESMAPLIAQLQQVAPIWIIDNGQVQQQLDIIAK